jgi:ANTAR domain
MLGVRQTGSGPTSREVDRSSAPTGPIGGLDLYSAAPRDWDQAEISAAQVYAALAATLLSQAAAAQVKGRLAEQLRVALVHRSRIERAKGMLMVEEGIDDAEAFERLRSAARSSQRPLIEVVDEVVGCRNSFMQLVDGIRGGVR